ncbi:LysR substrate-binding domain-containing protein [Roseobacter sp. GAI101]|uniref:LysR substrate-binding domain-containing protein n=1 Tax=Roseobacter sp. (strain GAI101) TaxID=391589 RepID=UPI000187152E|nr:LysR substrate-binding domain-containing protein [Roseobacter sp. GAI101]EEB84808.1 transcriptional regulator, LysR family [Roseobacter sp. GAI101]
MPHSAQHLDRLRLRHLRLLELIQHQGSLRSVAEQLGLTQPAVSQMVKDLEFAFGVTLVSRSVRGVELTKMGALALQRARSGLAAFHTLAAELDEGLAPVVRVGTNPAMLFNVIPSALQIAANDGTDVRYAVRSGLAKDMTRDLWDGKINCYVGRIDWEVVPPEMKNSLRHVHLFKTDLVVVCSIDHPLAKRAKPTPEDLQNATWALPPEDSKNRAGLTAAFRNNGLSEPRIAVEVAADPNGLVGIAREMPVLAVLPRLVLTSPAVKQQIVTLDTGFLRLPPIEIGFLTLIEHEHVVGLQAFRSALVSVSAGLDT